MLFYLFRTFLVIGSVSFGGHMALIAMIRNKLVTRDRRMDDDVLSQGVAIASLLPGPMAVNVVAYVGYCLQGAWGTIVSVVAVLLPSFIMVLIVSILYFNFSTAYDISPVMIGIIPVVVSIIASVGTSMARKNCKHLYQWLIVPISFLVPILMPGYWAALIVLAVASVVGIWINSKNLKIGKSDRSENLKTAWGIVILILITSLLQYINWDWIGVRLFVLFSSLSLTLFGGGYVMVPLLKTLLVDQLSWLNNEEFVFGISIGQTTPGPILISAAFFGYKVLGVSGALLATLGIFFPSSALMVLVTKLFRKFKDNALFRAALEGVLPAVVGLILFSGFSLFKIHVQTYSIPLAIFILVISFVLVFKFQRTPPFVLCIGIAIAYLFNNIFS